MKRFALRHCLLWTFAGLLAACGGGGSGTTASASVPGAPTIGTATAGSASASVSFTAANSGSTATSFSVTCTPTSGTAVTVAGASSPISITGLTNGTNYSCAAQAIGSEGFSLASSASLVTPVASTAVTYSAPAPFVSAVAMAYTPSTALARNTNDMASRSRYMISDAAAASASANYLSIGSTYSAADGYVAESGTISSSATYNTYLSKVIHVVIDSSGYFRLDSHLHPNNSIDFDVNDSNKLKFRNNFGKMSSKYGYLTFEYNSTTKYLQAKKRYIYSYATSTAANGDSVYTPAWTEDTAFSSSAYNYYVNYSGGVYKLDSISATRFYLYDSPIDFGIPTFMNPNAVPFVTNSPAPFRSKVTTSSIEGTSGKVYQSVTSTAYKEQVATAGSDAATKSKADAYLATIKTAVEAAGGTLRYSTAVYTAFRDGALATKLVSDSIADGTPGQNLVPYVYFTNEKDTSGVYHPFMIVVNYGNQASPNGLVDIPHPPGDGSGGYPASKVTRFSNLENYAAMIPMKDYGKVSAVGDNTVTKNLWGDIPGTTATKNVYTYADSADNGLLIDGSVIFPTYNNTLVPSHLAGELSASGCHVGQGGGGPHCHSDGYQAGSGLALYNDSDYSSKTHPPLIGFGYDGIALFGIYRSADTAMLGYTTALDDFGGHNHDSIGYHFHAHTVAAHKAELLNYTTTLYVLMKGAYIGKTNSVPCFRTNSNFNNNPYLGGTVATSARIC